MTDPDAEARARSRFIAMQFVRLSGVAMALFGVLILGGKVDLPREAGYVLGVVGLFDAFIAPILLARRWKSGNK